MDKFLSFLDNNWVFAIISFFIGFFIEKLMDLLIKCYKRQKNRKSKDDIVQRLEKELNIKTISYALPSFETVKINIDRSIKFSLSCVLYSTDDLSYLNKYINREYLLIRHGISDTELDKIISETKNETFFDFKDKVNGKIFNNELYGVKKVLPFMRTSDRNEYSYLVVDVYKTDYFTMNVMSQIIRKLEKKSSIRSLDLDGIDYFRNSIGVNVLVILPATNEIIIVERSKRSAYSEDNRLIYPSVVETLSIADHINHIDLGRCVDRGIEEELGLKPEEINRKTLKTHAFFFEGNYIQDNFLVSIEIEESIVLKDIQERLAKDRLLEISKIYTITNSRRAIKQFIKKNRNRMQYQTIYALEIYSKINL